MVSFLIGSAIATAFILGIAKLARPTCFVCKPSMQPRGESGARWAECEICFQPVRLPSLEPEPAPVLTQHMIDGGSRGHVRMAETAQL